MVKAKKYDYSEIEYSNYDLDLCLQKDLVCNLLKKSTPNKVARFNSKGSYWGFTEYADVYHIAINGAPLHFTTYVDSFDTVINFIDELMYEDNKILICPFADEGSYDLIVITPFNEDYIRCTTFGEKGYSNRESIFITSDIVIKKMTFIKQWKSLFEKINKDYKKYIQERLQESKDYQKNALNKLLIRFDKVLNKINQYIENPIKYKQIPKTKIYTRIYDIAYKGDFEKWYFVLAFDNDERGNIEYWENLKAEHKILDFDYMEQKPQYTECLEIDPKSNKYSNHYNGIIEPDYEERKIERNWCYSPETEKWYAENEIMDKPNVPFIYLPEELYTAGGINMVHNVGTESDIIKSYITDSLKGYGFLGCYVNFVSDNIIYTFEYDYNEKDELIQNLNKIKNGENIRFYLGKLGGDKRVHVWQKENGYIELLYQNSKPNMKKDTDLFRIAVPCEKFVSVFLNEISNIESIIKTYKEKGEE
mgnify:FL=1